MPDTFHSPVIFLPGTQCDERIWLPLWNCASFLKREYVPLQWANTLEDMLRLCDDRVLRHQEPVHIIGFSMGGYVACRYLEDIDASRIASLTLIGYAPQGLSQSEVSQRQQLIRAINKGQYRGMTTGRLSVFVHKSRMDDPSVADVVMDMDKDLGANVLRCHLSSTTPRPDVQATLKKATKAGVPIHFIGASDDLIAPPEQVLSASQALPLASCEIFDGAAHMLPLEQPNALRDHLLQLISR